ncbi:protein phosphatase 1 regulatory subunit 27 [Boleophthalmus pectinirostris]|uniref:protein phosphatase 1 regulatory subunit 27 n=1 Tax=Boleophthalmus pectinirostris TaxID=150288 RepID=UPI000A1C3BFB|nr:protein phosphatase 1 regulatory subunit 27 [Boleophthalmus pectinirostris]
MKYNYHITGSSYTRASQYTPSYHSASHYTPTSHYTPSLTTSSYTSLTKYSPTQYSSTHYMPSSYSSSYKTASSYVPSSYTTKTSRYTSTRRAQAQEKPPSPVIVPETPAKRTVHFPNDIVFQDIVRRGDLEQIGRFMRARKVRVDTLFHSGMAALHEAVLTGNLEVVKLLVKYGADVHQRDEDGWTPLHMACSDGYPEIARYLLAMGASTETENENGEKPADLIDPECQELAKLFETGCV